MLILRVKNTNTLSKEYYLFGWRVLPLRLESTTSSAGEYYLFGWRVPTPWMHHLFNEYFFAVYDVDTPLHLADALAGEIVSLS